MAMPAPLLKPGCYWLPNLAEIAFQFLQCRLGFNAQCGSVKRRSRGLDTPGTPLRGGRGGNPEIVHLLGSRLRGNDKFKSHCLN